MLQARKIQPWTTKNYLMLRTFFRFIADILIQNYNILWSKHDFYLNIFLEFHLINKYSPTIYWNFFCLFVYEKINIDYQLQQAWFHLHCIFVEYKISRISLLSRSKKLNVHQSLNFDIIFHLKKSLATNWSIRDLSVLKYVNYCASTVHVTII